MKTLQKSKKMNADEFFSWAREQEKCKFELISGEVVAMAPEVADHARVKFDIGIALRTAIKNADVPCEAFVDSLGVRIDDETVFEPDALVNCGERVAPDSLNAPRPVIVVEVISPSSRRKDTGAKLLDYFRVPSIQHYLVVDLQRRLVMHHARGEDAKIIMSIVSTGDLTLDPPGLTLQIADFFADV